VTRPSAPANNTGEVSWVQSIEATSSPAVTSAPVIVEISRRAGGRNENSRTTLRIGATWPAIAGEYSAGDASSSRAGTPSSASRCARSRTAATRPASTWQRGPL
jgi:hypothetical protein